MNPLNHLDLFSGIGGFALGLQMTGGFKPVAFCEIEPFPRKILAKHWPEVPCYTDVRNLNAETLSQDGIPSIDIITGGFPCQPHSMAGKRLASLDERDLWDEFARLIGEIKPRWVLAENVPGLLSSKDPVRGRDHKGAFFGRIISDLDSLGYVGEWHCIPASAFGAPHQRDRVWIVAYAKGQFCNGSHHYSRVCVGTPPQSQFRNHSRQTGARAPSVSGLPDWAGGEAGQPCPITDFERSGDREVERDFRGIPHGVSSRVDRLKGLGNAVVPQVVTWFGHQILRFDFACETNGIRD